MGFLGVYRALYDYVPQAQGELAIIEGDLLFVLEKSTEDDWWKAKKKAEGQDDEEPEGLIPNNYIEEAQVQSRAKALYEYQRQTDEELSFPEDASLEIYDTSDPDWTLAGLNGEYGFVPANYIDMDADGDATAPAMPARPRGASQAEAASQDYPSPAASPSSTPAAALASIIQQKTGQSSNEASRSAAPSTQQFTPEASDEEAPPPMPQRPPSQQLSPPAQYTTPRSPEPEAPGIMASPTLGQEGGYRMYSIHEMISHMGKNKKMPTTLGINTARGTILIAPERSKDGSQREWAADKLTHYSIEGKHVFMELVRPSKSIDFHAGAKDTATEIVSMLGELAGAARAEGFREVVAASGASGQKKGKMLYEFMAQGDDEVTVAFEDEVIVLDDTQSEEWWNVRRIKNGKEGVVPASYVEITGVIAAEPAPTFSPAAPTTPASPVAATPRYTSREARREANRQEEERLAREAVQSGTNQEVGPGLSLPDRHSSLGQRGNDTRGSQGTTSSSNKRSRRQSHSHDKPDSSKIRTWTDRTGAFRVEAQFLGLNDGKINLHKTNGVKIAVDVSKMSVDDIEYVEKATGRSLDEEKPLSEIRRRNTQRRNERGSNSRADSRQVRSPPPAASQPTQKPEYDWFDFFLQCGVHPQICERYASAFTRDQMGEENLQDISPTLLRTLGLKEGDILRVMKHLDGKFGRTTAVNGTAENEEGGLFSGPGGALRNNTRKGRPAPAVQSNDTVDPRAFEQDGIKKEQPREAAATPLTTAPERKKDPSSGFDDDAWDVKPPSGPPPGRTSSPPAQPATQRAAPTGAMSELSLLSPPLQPSPAPQQAPPAAEPQRPQPTGADPSFFDKLGQGQARQRPQAPQQQAQSSLLPPPPQRPSSAPQNQNAFAPPPLRPQMTGNQTQLGPPGQSLSELNQQRTMGQMYPQQTGYMYPQQTGYQQQMQPPMGFQPQQTGFNNQQQLMNGQMTGSPFADPNPRQQFQPMQPQQTGFTQQIQPQQTGVNSFLPPALTPQRTGYQPQQTNGYPPQQQQPLQPQQTGFHQNGYQPNGFQQQQQQQQPNGFNPLQPQQTGFPSSFGPNGGGLQPQPTGFTGQPSPFSQQQQPSYQQQQQQQQAPPMPPMPPVPQQAQVPTPAPLQPQKTGPAPPIRFGVQPEAKRLVSQPTGRRANLAAATPQNPFGF